MRSATSQAAALCEHNRVEHLGLFTFSAPAHHHSAHAAAELTNHMNERQTPTILLNIILESQ